MGDAMDVAKFEPILAENEKRIFYYLLKMVRNSEDAEDILQAVFYAFYQRMSEIDEKAAVVYLFRAAHNKALNFIKARKRYVPMESEVFERIPNPRPKPVDPREEVLRNAIAELPPRLATVISLQMYDDLSYKDIAERMNTTVSAVESLLVRAKRILRKKILQEMKKQGVS
jgi:RNA polymerase sigma-70 factor (ECF subfamily)